jgi:hypothetical protein
MRKNIIAYYVLLMLLVMGAFAAMALNSYGTVLMSYVALAFALVFLFEMVVRLPKEQEMSGTYKISLSIELMAMSGLCLLYFLKGIGMEITFTLAKLVLFMILLGVNAYHLVRAWHHAKETPVKVKGSIALYFMTLLLFMASNFLPSLLSWVSIVLAFGCLILFIVFGWWKGKVILNGEETSAWKKVIQFRNKSGIQLIFFAVATLYFVLNTFRLLPPLYNGSLPNGYSNVQQQWDDRKQNPDKTSTSPEDFENAYKKFLEGK